MDEDATFCLKVVGMEEGESDYSVVHLGAETQGLPAFHRIVGEDEVTFNHYQFCHCFVLLVLGTANFDLIHSRGQDSTAASRQWNL